MLQPQPPPTPNEPFREVIHQYTDTLGTTQKQTTLANLLLQDITVFNEYEPTKSKDWLMDIETAADLTSGIKLNLQKLNQEDKPIHWSQRQSTLTSLGKK